MVATNLAKCLFEHKPLLSGPVEIFQISKNFPYRKRAKHTQITDIFLTTELNSQTILYTNTHTYVYIYICIYTHI